LISSRNNIQDADKDLQKKYTSRRNKDYDEADDDFDQNGLFASTKETAAIEYKDTQGNRTSLSPNP